MMRTRKEELANPLQWLLRLARLDLAVLAEVSAQPAATLPCLATVVVASFLCGLGSWLFWAFQMEGQRVQVLVRTLVMGSLLQVGAWSLWVYLTYQVLTLGYGTAVPFYGMARAMGLAFAPMALTVLMALAPLAIPLAVIPLAATVLLSQEAIEAVSGAGKARSLVANVVGFSGFALTLGILANVAEVGGIGGAAPGLFFFALD
jgi:hypothetical protein